MDGMNLTNALEQQQGLSQRAVDMNTAIQADNNEAMRNFKNGLTTMKQNDTAADETNLGKIAGYAVAGAEKIHEYKSAVKAGKVGEGFAGSKLAQRAGKVSDWLSDSSKGSKVSSAVSDLASAGKFTPRPLAGPLDEAWIAGKTDQLTERTARGAEAYDSVEGATGKGIMGESMSQEHFAAPSNAAQDTGATADATTDAGKGGSTLAKEAGAGAEEATETGGALTRVAGKLGASALKGAETAGKVAGGLASAAMLGDDVYNQISKGKFFYGANLGDNIGNTTNEIGSVMDIAGIATGDPFLVMAGVATGAVGSLISDISELFGHKKKEKAAAAKPPPVIQNVAAVDIAQKGYVAEAPTSTLQAVAA